MAESAEGSSLAFNWTWCCLCQKPDGSKSTKLRGSDEGYAHLNDFLPKFDEIGSLSFPLDAYNDGSGILPTLQKNQAKYHAFCYKNYSSNRLNRKRKCDRSNVKEKEVFSNST